ncbi:SHOCT domain-containing protein [bacterium]|nr:SHOCT domain-containing protein [bacterium]
MLIWIAVIVLVVWLIVRVTTQGNAGRSDSTRSGNGSSTESAKEVLDRRFAQGEITREQYLQMKKDLGGD